MSKAGLLKSLLGEIAPKAAAPAAGAGLMFPSDDADAGVKLRLLQDAPTVYNALRKQIIQGQKNGLSPNRVAEKFIHDKKFTNYDGKFPDDPTGFNGYAKKVDGQISGDYWKRGVQSLYNDILGAVDEPDPLVTEAMDGWLESHVGREAGVSMAENRAKALALRKAGGGAVAATAAGGANAQGSGFPSFESFHSDAGAPSYASDDDQVLDHARYGSRSSDEAGFPAWSRYETGPSHGLPTPTWGDIGSTTLEVLDKPMSGLQGIVRGLYGLATGEGFTEAAAQAGHMMQGGSEEGFDRVGEGVESLLRPVDERFPYLKTGKAAGDTTSLGLSLLSPF